MRNQFIDMERLAFGIVGTGLISLYAYFNDKGREAHAGDQDYSEDNEELAELLADRTKKDCWLYLLIRPLKDETLKTMTYFTSLQHWAIGIDFGHRFLICEYSVNLTQLPDFTAYRNLDKYKKTTPDAKVFDLYSMTQSPHFFQELALEATTCFG